jgi:hypothetical protein
VRIVITGAGEHDPWHVHDRKCAQFRQHGPYGCAIDHCFKRIQPSAANFCANLVEMTAAQAR